MNIAQSFYDLHIADHKQKPFEIDSGHSRVYIFEPMVLSEDEYREKLNKDNDPEVLEAQEWSLSVEEYRSQKEWIEDARMKSEQHSHSDQDLEIGKITVL